MFNLERLRLPYREDSVFGLLALTIFIVPLAFFLLTNEGYETAKFSLILVLAGCALVAFLNRQPKGRLLWKFNKTFFYLTSAFLIWAMLSSIFSIDALYSIFGTYYRFTDGLVFYFALIVFIFLLINTLDRDRLVFLLKILVLDALIVSVVALLQAFNVTYYAGTATGLVQGPSLLGNPDFSAMFLAAVLPFAVYFWADTKKFTPLEKVSNEAGGTGKVFLNRWRFNAANGSLTGFPSKTYYGLCIFIIFTANLVFASRGALLAMFASAALTLVLLLIFRFPKKFFISLFLLCVLALAFGNFFLNVSRPEAIATIVQNVDSNTTSRLAAWRISINGVLQHPVLGSGIGTFALFFERNMSTAPNIGVFDDPHNLFLRLAVTGGLPFVLIFLGLLAMAAYYGGKKLKSEKDLLTLACLAAAAAWCVGASFNPVPVPMFMLLAVILAGLLFNCISEKNLALQSWLKSAAYIFAAVLIIFGTDLVASEYLFGFAKQGYLNENYQRSYKLSSLAEKINPTNRLYEIYRIGGEIGLNADKGVIVKDIEKFTTVHPGLAATYVEAGNMYNLLYASTGNKFYLKSAVDEMDRSLGIDKFYAERYGQKALYYYELGDLNASKSAVIKNLSLKDDDFAPWVLLAKIYQLEGNKAAAIQALSRAFKLRPDIPQLGYMLYLAKNLADIKMVPIQIAPQSPHLE
jgi:O-antigen ligase